MYRTICVLSLVALSVQAQDMNPVEMLPPVRDWLGTMSECLDKRGVNGEAIRNIQSAGELVRPAACTVACGLESMGAMDDKGQMNVENLMNALPPMPFQNDVKNLVGDCSKLTDGDIDDPCELAELIMMCVGRGAPLRFGWGPMAKRIETIFSYRPDLKAP